MSLLEPRRHPRVAPRSTWVRTTEIRKGIYVAGFGSYVKIGISTDVYERIATFQTPEKMQIYIILDGWISRERELHRRFSEYRLRGEWFRREGELAKWIIQVTASRGRNDGENSGRAKLTEVEVAAIRAEKGVPRRELAAKYGVSKSQIYHILAGKNWTGFELTKLEE